MISLRSFATLTAVVAAALTFSACSDATTNSLDPSGLRPGSANFNSSKSVVGTVDARVLLDKAGNAILELHTGTFDDATNTGTASGVFSSVTYTVKAGSKTISSHTVSFSNTVSSYFVHLNLCQSSNDDDDDGSYGSSSCNTYWASSDALTFSASLKGLGSDGKSTGTASGTASILNLPDIDLTQQGLFVVGTGGALTPASNIAPATATTFSVAFPNNKAIGSVANTVGAQTVCIVTVDGLPQLPLPNGVYNKFINPNAFGYVGSPTQNIAAGTIGSCQFTLTLPAGTHKIVVTAGVLYPGDYDLTNNSTASLTVNAVAGPPDIAASVLQQDVGAGAVTLGSVPVIAGTQIKLDQWVTLVSGAAPGTANCTLTIVNTAPNSTAFQIMGTAPLSGTTAACVMPVTFPTPGTYSITSVVSTPAGITDPVLTNNTVTNTLVVSSGPPSATVTVGNLTFNDPAEGISGALAAGATLADSVHAGDVVTYAAGLNLTAPLNTAAVNVTCKVLDGTTDITNAVTWVTGPALAAVPMGQASCVFTYAIATESDNAAHNHNITVSVTTPGSTNNAPAANTSLIGVITDIVRVDLVALPLQRVGNGVGSTALGGLDTTKLNTKVTIQATFQNTTSRNTTINCAITAPAQLGALPVGATTTNVSVPANGTGFCQYTITPTTLSSFPIAIVATPTATAFGDPNLSNNTSSGSIDVLSSGAFQSLPAADVIQVTQQWENPQTSANFPIDPVSGRLNHQSFQVTNLALLVVPNQAIVGTFGMSGTVTSGPLQATSFGMGTVPFQPLGQSTGGTNCITVDASLNSPPAAPLGFDAEICASPAPGGLQGISVSYTQTASSVLGSSMPLMFSDTVTMKIRLDFNLTPGATAPNDHVTATIKVPVVADVGPSCALNNAATPPSKLCSTTFGTAIISTP